MGKYLEKPFFSELFLQKSKKARKCKFRLESIACKLKKIQKGKAQKTKNSNNPIKLTRNLKIQKVYGGIFWEQLFPHDGRFCDQAGAPDLPKIIQSVPSLSEDLWSC